MNKMKKFASIATAVLMTACMAAPMTMSLTASAADVEIALSLPTPLPENSSLQEVCAYQIFAGTYQESTVEGSEGTLNISGWGNGIDVAKFITELKANEAFIENETNAFASVTYDETRPAVSAQAVADIVGKWQNDSATAKAFAKLAVLNINANNQITGNYNRTTSKVTFTGTDLPDGYYLFTCELDNVTNSAPNYDSMSLGMLTIIDNSATNLKIGSEGEAKVGLPEVMKKVYENTKSSATVASISDYAETDYKWNDVADYCIGDSVPFKLYGTMPQDIANYEHYYYNFTDTLGTQFDMPTSLTIKVGSATLTAIKGENGNFTVSDNDKNCRVSVNGQVISIS
ncbi:MAG: isopeptide-forming domain-containing fimbrial protein, partial [Oscillospiraceae bacterium]|nr:isopeptide-forming domain-containing fimbrial protein [Oscillospiraceae bacterium]